MLTNVDIYAEEDENIIISTITGAKGERGEKGEKGERGERGERGLQGIQGIQGIQGERGERGEKGQPFDYSIVTELPTYGLKTILYLIEKEVVEQTANGILINFTNSNDSGNLTDFEIQGNSIQSGTPSPDAPVAIQTVTGENDVKLMGKNLFKFAQGSGTATRSGITVEAIENGAIKVNGTVSGDAWFELMMLSNFLQPIQNTTSKLFALDSTKNYTLSVRLRSGSYTESTSSTNKTNVYIQTTSNNTQKNSNLGGTATTFTGADGIYRGWMRFIGGYTFNNAVLEIQLEEGSSASSYEPYKSQNVGVNLGKNLFDGIIEQGGFDGSGINVGGGNRVRSTNFISVHPNTKYTIKGFSWDTTKGAVLGASISYYSVNDYTTARLSYQNWVSIGVEQGFTFTTPSNCYYIRFLLTVGATAGGTSAVVPSDIGEIQIEVGSQATTYSPYFTPIELCKIGDYQDKIYKNEGKWYIEKQVGKEKLDGTEEGWGTGSGTAGFLLFYDANSPFIPMAKGDPSYQSLCDHFTFQPTSTTWTGAGKCGFNSIGTFWLMMTDTSITTVAQCKTWLASNPTTIYYPIATPTTTEITNEALINELESVLPSLKLYAGVNNLTTSIQTGNAIPYLDVDYVTYDKYNRFKKYIWINEINDYQEL